MSILATGCFAYRHPKHFNDPFDSHYGTVTRFDGEYFEQVFYAEAEKLFSDPTTEQRFSPNPKIKQLLETCTELARSSTEIAMKEFKIKSKSFLEEAKEQHNKEFGQPEWKNLMQGMRILCLSKVNDSVKMWSHYADSHQGVVIEVGVNEDPEALETMEYVKNYPEDIVPAVFKAKQHLGIVRFSKETMYKLQMTTKSHWWEEEQECRIILSDQRNSDPYFTMPGEITAVYRGINMPEINRTAIAKLCNALNSNIEIFDAKIRKNDYGVEFMRTS